MENAGRGVAEIVRRELDGGRGAAPVAVVCGAGSNGGDGFVAARHLARAGVATRVLLAGPRAKLRGDAAVMLAALERMGGVPIEDGGEWNDGERWRARLADAGVIVDAIFGTGVRGEIDGRARDGDRGPQCRARAEDRRRRAIGPGRRHRTRGRRRVPGGRHGDDGRAQGGARRRRRRPCGADRGGRPRGADLRRPWPPPRAVACSTWPASPRACPAGRPLPTRGARGTCWWSPARPARRGPRCSSDRPRYGRAPDW